MSENLIKQMQFGVDTYDLVSKYIKDSNGNSKSWSDITSLVGEKLGIIVVNVLPTADESTMGNIYLIPDPDSSSADNTKLEYITIKSGTAPNYSYDWEMIGSTSVDLSNYVEKGTYTSESAGAHTHTVTVSHEEYSKSTSKLAQTTATNTVFDTNTTASKVSVTAGSAASWSASVDANGILSFSWSANTPTAVSASDVTVPVVTSNNSVTVATGALDVNGTGDTVMTNITASTVSQTVTTASDGAHTHDTDLSV